MTLISTPHQVSSEDGFPGDSGLLLVAGVAEQLQDGEEERNQEDDGQEDEGAIWIKWELGISHGLMAAPWTSVEKLLPNRRLLHRGPKEKKEICLTLYIHTQGQLQ